MKSNIFTLSACLDSNVIISAIAFGGKPLEILKRALCREFHLVTGPNVIQEVYRNLIGKLGLKKNDVDPVLSDILEISSIFVPHGNHQMITHVKDNLVLELALIGNCDVLVTGDRQHLLPLSPFKGIVIEPPSKFLGRLDSLKNK